ncbi:related to aflatoxin B1-aldehyde reductase GliO-like [Rhynchosporium graminicola]|uniref:Related to aflatoxin B1-aldehyde reductase GliO-like n=1 Tax=Rhynchosporium graminicola TaxID=2792576 RepID=A0A1E1K281_9HELO|nr:related to aflatoxin B1-aldehyde reductase GliO-like [Rhynchosporium commune]
MTFGPDTSTGARITSLDDYNTFLDHLQAAGYNEIDTARSYVGGKQEAFTKDAHWKERGLTLATKVYPDKPGKHSREVLTKEFNTSLKELGTDCVDIFYLHAADRSVPFAETLEAVDKLHKDNRLPDELTEAQPTLWGHPEGQVRTARAIELHRLVITVHGKPFLTTLNASPNPTISEDDKADGFDAQAFEVAEVVLTCKFNNWVRPTIYQGMYNAITRSLEHELIPACKKYGLDVVIYNPIAGGLFSGKYKSKDIPTEGRYRQVILQITSPTLPSLRGLKSKLAIDTAVHIGELYRKRYFKDSTFEALRVIEPVVEKHGLTMVETALRWVVNHSALNVKDGTDGVIIGVSSLDQLDQNLKDCEKGPLPEEVLQALDKAWKISQPDTPNYWHLDLKYTYDTRKALLALAK